MDQELEKALRGLVTRKDRFALELIYSELLRLLGSQFVCGPIVHRFNGEHYFVIPVCIGWFQQVVEANCEIESRRLWKILPYRYYPLRVTVWAGGKILHQAHIRGLRRYYLFYY